MIQVGVGARAGCGLCSWLMGLDRPCAADTGGRAFAGGMGLLAILGKRSCGRVGGMWLEWERAMSRGVVAHYETVLRLIWQGEPEFDGVETK